MTYESIVVRKKRGREPHTHRHPHQKEIIASEHMLVMNQQARADTLASKEELESRELCYTFELQASDAMLERLRRQAKNSGSSSPTPPATQGTPAPKSKQRSRAL